MAVPLATSCVVCFKQVFKECLRQHMEIHKPTEATWKCDSCEKEFSSKSKLTKHKKIHNLSMETFKCEICSKEYSSMNSLKRHLESHGERITKACDICSVEFISENGFKIHMEGHDNVPSPCSICQKVFKGRITLKRHFEKQHSSLEM